MLPDSSSTLPPEQRLELNSRDLSLLFLDDKNPDFDIPFSALKIGKKLGSGGFKDCYAGKKLYILELLLSHESLILFCVRRLLQRGKYSNTKP